MNGPCCDQDFRRALEISCCVAADDTGAVECAAEVATCVWIPVSTAFVGCGAPVVACFRLRRTQKTDARDYTTRQRISCRSWWGDWSSRMGSGCDSAEVAGSDSFARLVVVASTMKELGPEEESGDGELWEGRHLPDALWRMVVAKIGCRRSGWTGYGRCCFLEQREGA